MLNERHDSAGHEPGRSHGLAIASHFNHLDDAASCRDLHPTTSARGDDLVGARTVVGGHYDLDAITLHVLSVVRQRTTRTSGGRRRREVRAGVGARGPDS